MSGKPKKSKSLIELLATLGQPISHELAELLAAYGPPAEMPTYQGDAYEYARAVRVFEQLSATPEAAARRDAMERYFARPRRENHAETTEDDVALIPSELPTRSDS